MLLISWVVPGCDFSMGGWWKHETNICSGREAGRETLYVVFCDSWGSCKIPWRKGAFLYVFFYISHHTCIPCLSQCYSLTSGVNFTLSLTFYLSILFYIPPSTHFTPWWVFFIHFCPYFSVHYCFPKSTLIWPKCALHCNIQHVEL